MRSYSLSGQTCLSVIGCLFSWWIWIVSFWSILMNYKCSLKMFVCCKIFVVMYHPEIFKDIKPHFNQMSTPHWIVLIVTNVFSKQISVIAVFKSGYILFADSMEIFFPLRFGCLKWRSLCTSCSCKQLNRYTFLRDDPEMFVWCFCSLVHCVMENWFLPSE